MICNPITYIIFANMSRICLLLFALGCRSCAHCHINHSSSAHGSEKKGTLMRGNVCTILGHVDPKSTSSSTLHPANCRAGINYICADPRPLPAWRPEAVQKQRGSSSVHPSSPSGLRAKSGLPFGAASMTEQAHQYHDTHSGY